MKVEVTAAEPAEVEADVLALAAGGLRVRRLDALFEGRLVALGGRTRTRSRWCQVGRELRARRHRPRRDGRGRPGGPAHRGGPGRARVPRRRHASRGRSTTRCRWPRRASCRPIVEGAVLGSYDAGRWKSEAGQGPPSSASSSAGPDDELARGREPAPSSSRAGRTSPASSSTRRRTSSGPTGLAERAAAIPGLRVDVLDAAGAGLPALAAVGGSSAAAAAAHRPAPRARGRAPERPRLALVGKAVTFDAGGYFLKPQSDIVRQKGDMAGGAAVLAAMGAIAELEPAGQRDRGPRRPART